MTFGSETDEEGSFAQLDRFVEVGGNFIDTANVYSGGESEAIIGRWLASRHGVRDQVVLATKARFSRDGDRNDLGLSRTSLTRNLDASLRRLGVERIDLYQAHAWDALTPLEETWRFYDDAVRAGKIGYVGVSNFVGWQLQKAVLTARHLGYPPIVTLQPQYNLLQRSIELEAAEVCVNEGVGILPWSPLGGGWLTGKYQRDTVPTGDTRLGDNPERGMEGYKRRNEQERTWRILDTVKEIAEQRDASMAQISLAWLADRPAVTSVILGARTLEQLDDNLGAAGLHLSEDEADQLTTVSAPVVDDYPYGEPGRNQRSRAVS